MILLLIWWWDLVMRWLVPDMAMMREAVAHAQP